MEGVCPAEGPSLGHVGCGRDLSPLVEGVCLAKGQSLRHVGCGRDLNPLWKGVPWRRAIFRTFGSRAGFEPPVEGVVLEKGNL